MIKRSNVLALLQQNLLPAKKPPLPSQQQHSDAAVEEQVRLLKQSML
jgi:hypothetical protein